MVFVADRHTNSMRPLSRYNDSNKHTSKAQDPSTSLENAETAYIDILRRLNERSHRADDI